MKSYIDAFNPIYIGTRRANQFDKYTFYESLIMYDEIVLSNDHILYCISEDSVSANRLIRLIKNKKISIFHDFIPFTLSKHDSNDIMIELKMNEPIDPEYLEKDERFMHLKKSQRKFISRNTNVLNTNSIDIDDLCNYICEILNNKELLIKIYRSTKPYHMLNDMLPKYEYIISVKERIFFINTDEEHKKSLSSILVGEFFPSIIRSYIHMHVQLSTQSNTMILSPPNRTIFDELSSEKQNSSTDKINYLMKVERMPDLYRYLSVKDINFNDVMDLRVKSRNLRDFINSWNGNNDIDFYKEYRDRIDNEHKFLNNTWFKTIKLALTTLIAPIGIVEGIGDIIGANDRLINNLKPTIRLSDIFE